MDYGAKECKRHNLALENLKGPETNAMKIEWSDLISSIKDCVKKTEAKPCMKNVDETMFEYYV